MAFTIETLQSYPERPGVYIMKGEQGCILYIGKAKSLKQRIKQYFQPGRDERIQIPFLVAAIEDIDTIIVQSEKEALLLEARLIRRFKPKYNILLKDDRSHLMLRLSLEHEWPRIEYIRSKNISSVPPQAFGPFSKTRDMFEMAVRLFQMRQCSDEEFKRRKAPCLLHQMKRCSAPCVHNIDHNSYQQSIQHTKDFLSGKISWVREKLYEEMQQSAANLDFEYADLLLKRIYLLDDLSAKRQTDRIDGITDCDVIGIWKEGSKGLAITLMHYRSGFLNYSEGWVFQEIDLIEAQSGQIADLIGNLILQLYQNRLQTKNTLLQSEIWMKELLLPQECLQSVLLIEEALSELFNEKIIVKCPVIGPKAKLVKFAIENAQARLAQKANMKEIAQELLTDLMQQLCLQRFPQIIDCFDASHFGGKGLVATCISFENGVPFKKRYRTFKTKMTTTPSDVDMIKDAIIRRYKMAVSDQPITIAAADSPSSTQGDITATFTNRENIQNVTRLPDLIIIDGGKGQLHAAYKALKMLGIENEVDLIALTKEAGRHDKGLTKEKIFCQDHDDPILLSARSSALLMLQKIRDEAHRFSITFQKKQRSKNLFTSSLDSIPNIGSKKKQKLLQAFTGVKALQKATASEIAEKAKISLQDAERVKQSLQTDFFEELP